MDFNFFSLTLLSYAQVFFINDYRYGIPLLLATFIDPWMGIIALFSVICSNYLASKISALSVNYKYGIYGLNGLFVGLYLASEYEWNIHFLLILLLSILTVVFIAKIWETYLFYRALPIISFPFCITIIILSLSLQNYPLLLSREYTHIASESILEILAISLSYIFFLDVAAVSLIILLCVFFYSRISFFSGVIGSTIAVFLSWILFTEIPFFNPAVVCYNAFLGCIGLAAFFFVPSAASLTLGIFSVCLLVPLYSAFTVFFQPWNIPIVTLPFNVLMLLFLYAFREQNIKGLFLNAYWALTPENALRSFEKSGRLLDTQHIPIQLPFLGTWKVEQGHNGEITHKDKWCQAWDFVLAKEIEWKHDPKKKPQMQDFITFSAPIVAPAPATVVYVDNNIPDNPPFDVNTEDNWGNQVIFSHSGGIFTRLCHLKQESIQCKVGGNVKDLEYFAQVGNSGRSPTPHLHFQFQATMERDCPTFSYPFSAYLKESDGSLCYIFQGIPDKGDIIQRSFADFNLTTAFEWTLDQKWEFNLEVEGIQKEETWLLDLDFYGKRFLKNELHESLGFAKSNFYYQTIYSPLHYSSALSIFGLLLPLVPFNFKKGVFWEKDLDPHFFLSKGERFLIDSFFFLNTSIALKAKMEFVGPIDAHIREHIVTLYGVRTTFFKTDFHTEKVVGNGEIWFDPEFGPVHFSIKKEDLPETVVSLKGFESFIES
ncbi:urea transporter [Candidatus Riflebacteria bacterium]